MAKRPGQQVPDAVRDAVERTIQATVGSAQTTRERAQEAVDEVVRGAGASAESLRERVLGAIEERRPRHPGGRASHPLRPARHRPAARRDRGAAAGEALVVEADVLVAVGHPQAIVLTCARGGS
jgi:hypothetical protein